MKGRQFSIYVPPKMLQYFPVLKKWMQEKGLIDSDKTTHMIGVCIALMLNEMFKEVDKSLVDGMVATAEKKGIYINEIDSITFNKLLK